MVGENSEDVSGDRSGKNVGWGCPGESQGAERYSDARCQFGFCALWKFGGGSGDGWAWEWARWGGAPCRPGTWSRLSAQRGRVLLGAGGTTQVSELWAGPRGIPQRHRRVFSDRVSRGRLRRLQWVRESHIREQRVTDVAALLWSKYFPGR